MHTVAKFFKGKILQDISVERTRQERTERDAGSSAPGYEHYLIEKQLMVNIKLAKIQSTP